MLRIAGDLLHILQHMSGLRPSIIHGDINPKSVVLEGGQWGGRVFMVNFKGVQRAAGTAGRRLLQLWVLGCCLREHILQATAA